MRKSALVALKSGNKKVALRNAKELKLISGNREKWTSLLNRVDEVLSVIADAETTKKVNFGSFMIRLYPRLQLWHPLVHEEGYGIKYLMMNTNLSHGLKKHVFEDSDRKVKYGC